MKMLCKIIGFSLGMTVSAAGAQEVNGFSPRQSCNEILTAGSPATRLMAGAWTFGYLASKENDASPVDFENIDTILKNLTRVCSQNPDLSLLAVVGGSNKPSADVGGSEAHAHQMLMQFYDPNADRVALTQALRPSEADIRAIYSEPLASKLVAYITEVFTPGIAIGPKPHHNDLLIVHATTSNLRNRDAVLREFPGGYEDIIQYLNPGFPIVRFKFITSGETLGLAFDGLIYVNDRWVLVPKAWRAL